ncbi:MAG: response regulator [Opitutaceae bacterium]
MPRILAIDDSLTIRKMVEIILRGAGHEVLLAEQGAAGLELARTAKPDLILLDFVLPDLPSTEICRQLLLDSATASIPILLISTNGAAIRQLYADSRNVRDYLTKPFQAKVLQSVIDHLLAKRPAAPEDTSGAVIASASAASPTAVPTAPAPSGERLQSLRPLLNARFRAIAKMIPDLERRRGQLSAETFFLPFFLRNELLAEIAAVAARPVDAPPTPTIAGTHDWVGLDAALLHLGASGASGVFTLQTQGEAVTISLRQGRVVMVGSNNPRVYCGGAPYNFRTLPAGPVAAAVAAQQRDGVPFFVTLFRLGMITDPEQLRALLIGQGIRAVHRAFLQPNTSYAFVATDVLPEVARAVPFDLDAGEFVLSVLRLVDDWLEIESTAGSVETVYAALPDQTERLAALHLSPEETTVLGLFDGQRSLQAVAAVAGLELFVCCAAAYRLLRLGLLRTIAAPLVDTASAA